MNGMTESANGVIYLDTNFLIKAIEGTKDTAVPAQNLIQCLRERPGLAVTSELTFAEVLAPSKMASALPPHIKRRVYLDLLLWSKFIGFVPITRDILMETVELRVVAPLKLPDAIHLATAIKPGCRYCVSADKDFKKLPIGMELVGFDAGSLSSLVDKLS
jgi:predicted nucleic acid-binding protein